MVLRLCCILFFAGFASAQNYDIRHAALQNMIDYTAQFVNQHGTTAKPQVDPVETGKLEDDPFVRNLFKEFLVQYKQLAANEQKQPRNEQKIEPPTTTITPQSFSNFDYSNYHSFQNPTQPPAPVFPDFSEITPSPQKSRLVHKRRKMNTPQPTSGSFNHVTLSTTPFSTPLGHVNSRHDIPVENVKNTNTFSSLRQRYFGVDTSITKKPLSPLRFTTTTTPAPQEKLVEELPSSTKPFKSVPHLKIPQRLAGFPSKPLITASKPSTASSKLSTVSPKVATPSQEEFVPEFDEKEFRRQAENAKYEFASEINDEINGNLHQREEVRDGLTVRGKYSYSDGYFKRTVHYEADDKGYRVIKEQVEPLEGPQLNPDGQAKVSSYVAGNAVNYQITKDDIMQRNQKAIFIGEEPIDEEVDN